MFLSLFFFLAMPASAGSAPEKNPPAAQVPAAVVASTPSINIVYPSEGYQHPFSKGAWIMGWVHPPTSKLRVNGQPVAVHPLGGFLGYLPITPGTFTFHCELELPNGTTTLDRAILVAEPLKPDSTAQALIDPEPMQPSEDLELRPGAWLFVEMKGTPGGKAQFQIKGRDKLPLVEANPYLGVYRGAYQIQPSDAFDHALIYFYLTGPKGSSVWKQAPGKLTVRAGIPEIAVVKSSSTVNVRSGRGDSFILFPGPGTKFLTDGRDGPDTLLRLGPDLSGAVPTSALHFLPDGTPPPQATLGSAKTEAGVDSTTVFFNLDEIVPFAVEDSADSPDVVALRLFYTRDHTNWIIYDPADSFIRDIRWEQEDATTVKVRIRLSPSSRLWGYEAHWDAGGLRLALRHPPKFAPTGSVLKGRIVVVDPGHMPSAPGAFGPRGVLEKDVNLAIATFLAKDLTAAGAKPVMTRPGDDEVSLSDRPRIARERGGELFVSVHANSMPDGEDPFAKPNGFQIFYYQPFSYDLGAAVHRAYQKEIDLPDEGLRYGDLLVARITEMPAILTESAYIIIPAQEVLLTTPSFQKKVAKAIFDGIRAFFDAERKRQWQGKTPAGRRAR